MRSPVVISLACNLNSEILAALQLIDAVTRTQRHRLHEKKRLRWLQVIGRDNYHVVILIPVGLSSGLST